MFAELIPAQKLPRGLSALSYQVPKEYEASIKIGQIFLAPLRRATTLGVVVALKPEKKQPFAIKPLKKMVYPEPLFTLTQLNLFIELSKYYGVSPSLFVHYSLPQIAQSDWPGQTTKNSPPVLKNHSAQARTAYCWWRSWPEKKTHYQKKVLSNLRSGSVLIVVPQISDIIKIATLLSLDPSDYTTVHGHLNKSSYANIWQLAYQGHPHIFIGTRRALFLPYNNLRLIAIDDEHSEDHKQSDRTPRYTVKHICQTISQLQKTKLLLFSPCPSVESYYQFKLQPKKAYRPISVIDLKNELQAKNYSFLSDQLITAVKQTAAQNKKTFLFVNKKGEASTNTCADCGYTFLCPTCSLPLTKEKKSQLACYHCRHKEDFPPFCPQCGRPHFKSLGLGLEKIAQNINKILPAITVSTISNDRSHQEKNNSSLIIGTQFATSRLNWEEIGLLGIINADQLWQHSEFMARERAYQTLVSLLTSAPKNASLIIQTFSPDDHLIQSLKQNNPDIFYQEELGFRKQFSYPPFGHLIKISTQHRQEKLALANAEKIYTRLKTVKNIDPSPPLLISRRLVRGRYKFNLIIKFSDASLLPQIIGSLPPDCLLDIDPQNLLN